MNFRHTFYLKDHCLCSFIIIFTFMDYIFTILNKIQSYFQRQKRATVPPQEKSPYHPNLSLQREQLDQAVWLVQCQRLNGWLGIMMDEHCQQGAFPSDRPTYIIYQAHFWPLSGHIMAKVTKCVTTGTAVSQVCIFNPLVQLFSLNHLK